MRRRPLGLACLSLAATLVAVPAGAASCGRATADRKGEWFVSTPKLATVSEAHRNLHWNAGDAIQVMAVDPADPRVVFVANGAHLMRTNDGGCSWTEVYRLPDPPALGPDSAAYSIYAIDVVRVGGRTRVLLGVLGGPKPTASVRTVVVRSDDGYRDWTPVDPGFPGIFVTHRSGWAPVVRSAGGVTYAAVPSPTGAVAYHRSADGGKTWALRSRPDDTTAPVSINGFAVNPWNPDELFEWSFGRGLDDGFYSGLRRSTDGGASWTWLDPWPAYQEGSKPSFQLADVAWPRRGGPARVLIPGVTSGDLAPIASWSGDGGRTFSLAIPPTRTTPLYDATVTHLANGDAIIVASNRMVYRLYHRGRAPRRADWVFLRQVPQVGATFLQTYDPTLAAGSRPAVVVVRNALVVQFHRLAP